MGIFEKILLPLLNMRRIPPLPMIDATYLKTHRTAAGLREKKGFSLMYRDEQKED